jgi:hypothetical protein
MVKGSFGWVAVALGALAVWWSLDAFFIGAPHLNQLDMIDLAMGLVAAATLGVMGLRLLVGKSPWKALIVGAILSIGLFALALFTALQGLQGSQ